MKEYFPVLFLLLAIIGGIILTNYNLKQIVAEKKERLERRRKYKEERNKALSKLLK